MYTNIRILTSIKISDVHFISSFSGVNYLYCPVIPSYFNRTSGLFKIARAFTAILFALFCAQICLYVLWVYLRVCKCACVCIYYYIFNLRERVSSFLCCLPRSRSKSIIIYKCVFVQLLENISAAVSTTYDVIEKRVWGW